MGQSSCSSGTPILLYYLYKIFAPGSPDEKVQLINNILNPNVCTNPKAAQVELLRWKENIRRCAELGCYPPDLMLTYRAMESIFSAIFDKAEPQLHARWVNLRNDLGLPHVINVEAVERVSTFANTELAALVLHGGTSLNTGLPLTDNQKARLQQIKESDKRRAAAAKTAPTRTAAVTNNSTTTGAVKLSSTTSSWANPCISWTQTGLCLRGISCHFAHAGIPLSDHRCLTCGSRDHMSKDCTCPGGGSDPNRVQVWEAYRARKQQALEKGKASTTC